MDLLTKALLEDLLDTQKTVAIYGGGFKPPTKGHFTVAKQTLEQFPEIDELKIFVGGGVRDGVTQDESIKIWNIYKKYLSPKVDVEASIAPVKSVLGYAKENPDIKIYWILGVRDGDEGDLADIGNRTKSLSKYPNLEVKIITTSGGVSGTKTRQAVRDNNKEQFFHLIPNVSEEEKQQMWDLVSPVVKEGFIDDVKTKLQKFIAAIKQEGQETKEAVSLLIKAAKGDIELSDKQKEQIGNQLKDVLKTIGLTAIAVLPGGFIAGALIKLFKAEHLVTPSSFINEVNIHQKALSQTEKEALEITYKNWDMFGGKECNNGFCDIFAKNLSKYLPGSKMMSTEDPRNSTFGHVWVEYEGKYFDAETPNGVDSWKQLPWMIEFYSKNNSYPTDIEKLNEVGEANLKPYKWKEVDIDGYWVYTRFITDNKTQYDVDLKTTNYIDDDLNNYKALEIEFTAKPKGAEIHSAITIVNKGEMYKVMSTIVDIVKHYIKKFKAKAIMYSPSKKSDEEDFGTQRDNLYKAFITKAIPGVTFKQSGNFIIAILPDKEILNEGRYDSITRLVVKDIMNSWKSQFDGKEGELRFEEDYELGNSKGQPIDFELLAVLKLEETEDKTYIVDGGANEELDPPYLEVTFQVDPRSLPKMWSTIYNDLIDVVRHEIEHLTQSGINIIPPKEMADDQSIRQIINWGLLPKVNYFRLEKEVDAMLQGMYLKAKKSRTPFKDVIDDYFEKVELEGEDKQDVLDLWTKRLKALNLPPIKEASNPEASTTLPYGSGFASVKELVTDTEVICDNCGWEWSIADGGKDLYICHKCGHDNTPKADDPFGLNELARQFLKETLKETWNPEESFLSLSKYMIDNGMNIKPLPKIKVIKNDEENASNLLGKTAYYNPNEKSITLYTMGRHPKDLISSFSHEMIHHMQNLEGRLNNIYTTNTLDNNELLELEREAYEMGGLIFRKYQDFMKKTT